MKFEYSAGAVIYKEGRDGKPLFLLLMKKNNEYDIPKGHIEKGESSEEAARREIKEETGLDVNFIPGFSTVTKYFFYVKKEKTMKTNRLFLSRMDNPKVRISHEHRGYYWLTYEQTMKAIKYKNTRQLFTEANWYIERCNEMEKLNREYSKLPEKEKGWGLSRRLVPGEGPLSAKVMIIGQAPGRNEDERQRPFIGRAGILLGNVLSKARLKREKIYITSIVQFFPPENRMPTDKEVELCLPFLKRQIELIKPAFIITLGSLSSGVLIGVKSIEKDHGKIIRKARTVYMPTYHPAAALRFPRLYKPIVEDLRKFSAEMRKAGGNKE